MRRRVPFLLTGALALVLAWMLAPRPSTAPKAPAGDVVSPLRAGFVLTEAHASIRPLVIGRRRTGPPALPRILIEAFADEPAAAAADDTQIPVGFLTGHVVDEQGFPIKQAVIHLHGPSGTVAHRIDEDGTFHIAVPEGRWTAEAGWYDGEDEWRSKPAHADVVAGENVSLPFEILMEGAAHGVHSAIEEKLGVGWEVARDDGPLRAGDVLVEVDGLLLSDLQPESVKAALRSRPGETIPAVVLRPGASGDYEEVAVVLDAR